MDVKGFHQLDLFEGVRSSGRVLLLAAILCTNLTAGAISPDQFTTSPADDRNDSREVVHKEWTATGLDGSDATRLVYSIGFDVVDKHRRQDRTEDKIQREGNEIFHGSNMWMTTVTEQDSNVFTSNGTDINNISDMVEQQKLNRSLRLRQCCLTTVDGRVHDLVTEILSDQGLKVINYEFTVFNYTKSPLRTIGQSSNYKLNSWSRVVSGHGQTILKLTFNYAVLSLMTLGFGVETLRIELQDIPSGCARNLTENEQLDAILDITLRDFKDGGDIMVVEGQSSVCHQVIQKLDGFARFARHCCYRQLEHSTDIRCEMSAPNKWLETLDVLLSCLFVAVFTFAALFLPDWLYSATLETAGYIVKLKEPLFKTICICRKTDASEVQAHHRIDLRSQEAGSFTRCKEMVRQLPSDVVVPVCVSQFDILVNYRKLLTENRVPVSVTECISKALFLCRLRELDAFGDCCKANAFGRCCPASKQWPWISICEIVGRVLVVLLFPLPFYVRLLLYYMFENSEVTERNNAARLLGLPVYYNYRLMQYFTPFHPVFVMAYVTYFSIGIFTACRTEEKRTRYQQAVIDSFGDLKEMSLLAALRVLIRNVLYPFRHYGMFGFIIGIVLWPILLTISGVCLFYSMPVVFLTCRIFHHTLHDDLKTKAATENFKMFEAEILLKTIIDKLSKQECCYCYIYNCKRLVANLAVAFVAMMTIYSVILLMSEVIGFVAEILCFTLMGLIVNATRVFKYGSLIFFVIIYSSDCFNNVKLKYRKLNKALFAEIKGRIHGLAELTSRPSYLQKNTGLKACEASEQDYYETTDDLSSELATTWDINDLILFVASDDTPRIPRRIFDKTCEMRVAGSPGPVYRSLLAATGRLGVIVLFLVFVFIVVMSFGEAYKVSSANQMLATLAGGFMPMILNSLLQPVSPDVETNLVGFKNKLEEIIKNFRQPWPMQDFVFDIDNGKTANLENDKNNATMSEMTKSINDRRDNSSVKLLHEAGKDCVRNSTISAMLEEMQLQSLDGAEVDIVIITSEECEEWVMNTSIIVEDESVETATDNCLSKRDEMSRYTEINCI